MLDIKFIRENPDLIKTVSKNKKVNVDIDELLEVDSKRRKLIANIEALNQEKNEAAKTKDIQKGKMVKDNLSANEIEYKEVAEKFSELMYKLPNFYSKDTPIGKDESKNVVKKKVGEIPSFDFKPKEHWQLGEELGIIDTETASEVSGARFSYMKGGLALLEFAVIQFVLKTLT